MQRVGGERVASGFRGDAPQRAPSHEIDRQREADRRERERVGVDAFARLAEPPDRLERDPDRERREEAGLRQRGDRLDLGVAERMFLVRRLVRRANREIGRRADGDVEQVVGAFGEQRQRARERARAQLGERQGRARRSRGERRALLARRGRIDFVFFRHHGHA